MEGDQPPPRPSVMPRVLAAASVLTVAGTYLAARVDFARRHTQVLSPTKYWAPQLLRIWLPGLGAAAILAVVAWLVRRGGAPPRGPASGP